MFDTHGPMSELAATILTLRQNCRLNGDSSRSFILTAWVQIYCFVDQTGSETYAPLFVTHFVIN